MRPSLALWTAALVLMGAPGCATTEVRPEDTAIATMRQAVEAAQAHDFGRAKTLAEQAAGERRGFIDPYMLMAWIAEQRGDYYEARHHYKDVLQFDPTNSAAGVALGFTYVKEQQFDDARGWFMKSIEADPGCEAAAFNMGSLAAQLDDPEQALAWFDVAAALDRRDPRALIQSATILLKERRPQEALALADEALKRYPPSQPAQAVRAQALHDLGRD